MRRLLLLVLLSIAYSDGRGLIHGGAQSNQYYFPSAAPLFYNSLRNPNFGYFCVSNIITKDFVVTAAHCLWLKDNIQLRWDQFYVYVGRNSLNTSVFEKDSLKVNPAEIYIHQDWDSTVESYDGDIALIKLEKSIIFSDRIKPIALPPSGRTSEGRGIIFGWGASEDNDVEINPKFVKTESISAQMCRRLQEDLYDAISDRSFCVGGLEKRTPCSGDSGGGFYKEQNDQKVLYGIISAGGEYCGDDKYAVVTDVPQFVGWMETLISQTTIASEFGWIANIFYGTDEFLCSGSVITARHVLTAASCIQAKDEPQPPPQENFRVEVGSETFKVFKLLIHPNWDFTINNLYKGDVAILVLDNQDRNLTTVKLNYEEKSPKFIASSFREKETVRIPIHERSYKDCILNNRTMNSFLDPKTMSCAYQLKFDFCSIGEGETIFTDDGINQSLYGLVSIGFKNVNECHQNKTLVVTNLKPYYKWIHRIIDLYNEFYEVFNEPERKLSCFISRLELLLIKSGWRRFVCKHENCDLRKEFYDASKSPITLERRLRLFIRRNPTLTSGVFFIAALNMITSLFMVFNLSRELR